ncbi:RNA polymerase-binding protein DksA [Caenimonas aquaedulcis]|uniref:RNA polymerase-binding protein DksA n=1 Tax=Caenimonas aquaedulcis TaxID=2793270 RepID=UPI00338E9C55
MKPQPKAGKTAAKAKPAAKAVKAAAKPAAKKATPAKAARPAAKAATKPTAKGAVKSTVTSKAPAKKAAAKPAAKAAAKAPAKSAPAKSAPASKKPAPQPQASPAVKAAAKPKATPTQPEAKAKPPANGQAAARAMPPRPDAATLGAEPARATKPSARLAQITVPSMAQSVASTAAKASYTQTMSQPVLTPPPLVAIKKDPKLANNWKTKTVDQLTDAEVLAMPDSEYMNEKQMGFFRLKLAQLKQEILNSAGETTEHLREDTVIVPDPADRATIEEEHALELRTRDRERKLLKKIEQSIARIDAGDYGYCDETGEPIGVGRLLARPTATLSLEAQQRRELKQKMFGD